MAKPGEALTEENYDEHVAQVPGIFGDVPTDGTSTHDSVVTKDEAAADTAIAEKDAAVEEGDEEAAEVSDAEAARQADAEVNTGFADEVDEAAAEQDEAEGDADASAADADASDEDASDDKTAVEVVAEIEAADSAEQVDELAEGDERVTVQRAADKRKGELSE